MDRAEPDGNSLKNECYGSKNVWTAFFKKYNSDGQKRNGAVTGKWVMEEFLKMSNNKAPFYTDENNPVEI